MKTQLKAGRGGRLRKAAQPAAKVIRPIDPLATDVTMPSMGGRELADSLRPRYPQMKILLLSDYSDDDVLLRGIMQENGAFLQKPSSPPSLRLKVRQVLDRPEFPEYPGDVSVGAGRIRASPAPRGRRLSEGK